MSKIDVLVIGAGPAGSIAAALLQKQGFTIRVVEKEKFPRFVIGESLLPRCMEVLEDADLLDAVKAMGFQEKFGAKFVRGNQKADYNFSDQHTQGWTWTWQVPRAKFDETLINTVASRNVPVSFETTVNAIEFLEDDSSITTVQHKDGAEEKIEARFIVDASGYGRVIPKLFNLDKPSTLTERKAIFAHVRDTHRSNADEPNRITIVSYAPETWVWIIPFSDGVTSVGFVGKRDYFRQFVGDTKEQFNALISNNNLLQERFSEAEFIFEPKTLEAWSTTTQKFYGKGFVLTGNVTEFLDPVFSSGVMLATVSSQLAAKLVTRQLNNESVDWQKEYTQYLQRGVDVFRSYVTNWYDGTLEKIFYAENQDLEIKKQICSVLAGYVWDETNPYVRDHVTALKRLARMINYQGKDS